MPVAGSTKSRLLTGQVRTSHKRHAHVSNRNLSAIAANQEAFQCVQDILSLVQQIHQQMTKESGRAACRVECCELYSHTVASTELSRCLSRDFSHLFSRLSYEAEYPMRHYHDATAVDRVIALADLALTGLEQFKDAQAQQPNLYTAMATVGGGYLHRSLVFCLILAASKVWVSKGNVAVGPKLQLTISAISPLCRCLMVAWILWK